MLFSLVRINYFLALAGTVGLQMDWAMHWNQTKLRFKKRGGIDTVSLLTATICLRAGWSIGTVKDYYLYYEKAGDQYVGQTVVGT